MGVSESQVTHHRSDCFQPRFRTEFFVWKHVMPKRAEHLALELTPEQNAQELVHMPVPEKNTHPGPEVRKASTHVKNRL